MTHRRELLKFLAASPLITTYAAFAQEVEETLGQRLTDPDDVINVWEMEAVAREKFRRHTLVTCPLAWMVMAPCAPIGMALPVFRLNPVDWSTWRTSIPGLIFSEAKRVPRFFFVPWDHKVLTMQKRNWVQPGPRRRKDITWYCRRNRPPRSKT